MKLSGEVNIKAGMYLCFHPGISQNLVVQACLVSDLGLGSDFSL